MHAFIPAGAGEIMQYIVHPFNDNTLRFALAYPALLQGLVEEREGVCIHVFALQMHHGDISVPVSQQLGRSAVLDEPSAPLHCLFIGI